MKKIIKILINATQYALILLGLLVVFIFLVPRLFGIMPFIVLSGSMEPQIKTGSIAYSNTNIKAEDVKVGDIIVFKIDKTFVTHRAIKINEDNTFTTKGDANNTEDLSPVKFENYIGETIFTIPYLGYVLKAIQSRNGIFILLIIIGINIVYLIFSNDEKNKKAKVNKEK